MGIVIKQSIYNTITTYLGFSLGAINTLFLYTKLLSPQYYGLVTFILATAAILTPIMALGVYNALVKFYSEQKQHEKNAFLTLMLVAPLLSIVPLTLLTLGFQKEWSGFLAQENPLAGGYLWSIFWVALAMAYFEVFFAWSKVFLKSVFGNFMKEVFARLAVFLLLLALYMEWIGLAFFLNALVGVYVLRTLVMKLYVLRLHKFRFDFHFPQKTLSILGYSLLMILGGSAALILLEVDKFMINQFIPLENVAYYGVAVYIATVIVVPSRSMHQITYPLTAELLNRNDVEGLEKLYQKSSLTLLIASGLIFLLIILNLNDLYSILPAAYRNGFYIVLWIGLAKVFDSFLGNINSILYNSRYYQSILLFGVLLAITTILLNLWLIPKLGINGAALASFSAIVLFNIVKMFFVRIKFGFWPSSRNTLKVIATLLFLGALFRYLQLGFHPIVNITLKSMLMVLMYLGIIYRFGISEDLTALIERFFKKSS